MGLMKQYAGSYAGGFFVFAALAVAVLALLRAVQGGWTRTWVGHGGRARVAAASGATGWPAGRAHPQALTRIPQE
jgi:NNP family nitrate/nitrite transporter-like MFS transporter